MLRQPWSTLARKRRLSMRAHDVDGRPYGAGHPSPPVARDVPVWSAGLTSLQLDDGSDSEAVRFLSETLMAGCWYTEMKLALKERFFENVFKEENSRALPILAKMLLCVAERSAEEREIDRDKHARKGGTPLREVGHLVIDMVEGANCEGSGVSIVEAKRECSLMLNRVISEGNELYLDPRVLTRAVSAFSLGSYSDIDRGKLDKYVRRLLEGSGGDPTSAVKLIIAFDMGEFATKETIRLLVGVDREPLAEQLAQWKDDLSVSVVEECRRVGKLRFAWRTCKNLKVEKLFPNLQNEYRSSTLQKLFRKGQFDLAAAFVGRDEKLQRTFMEMLEAEGLKEAAFEIHSAYEMVCDLPFNGTNDNCTQQRWLQLPSEVEVSFVDTARGLEEEVRPEIEGAEIIAFDAEWRSSFNGEENEAVALLQISVGDSVFVIDVPKLMRETPNLTKSILIMMIDSSKTVLGYGIRDDLKRLSKTLNYDFSQKGNILDLRSLAKEKGYHEDGGLATLCEKVLGQPLNKVMRMSDWERRPLTTKMIMYAALDAYVLIPLFQKIMYSPKNVT